MKHLSEKDLRIIKAKFIKDNTPSAKIIKILLSEIDFYKLSIKKAFSGGIQQRGPDDYMQ